jgi:protein-S-isoprenylcysteine O-methyltransferase Ste14
MTASRIRDVFEKLLYPVLSVFLVYRYWEAWQVDRWRWLFGVLINFIFVGLLILSRRPKATVLTFRTLVANLLTFAFILFPFTFSVTTLGRWSFLAFKILYVYYLFILLLCYLALGRNIGILPSLRKITRSGVYRLVRHPIYSCWFHVNVTALTAFPTKTNLLVGIASMTGMSMKIIDEEKVLSLSSEYVEYKREVKRRILHPVMTLPAAAFLLTVFYDFYLKHR